MRLTTKGRFAVTAMIDLALRQHTGPVTLAGSASARRFPFPIWSSCSASCVAAISYPACAVPAAAIAWPSRWRAVSVADIIHAVDETAGCHQLRRQGQLRGRPAPLHDPRPVDQPQREDVRVPELGHPGRAGGPAARAYRPDRRWLHDERPLRARVGPPRNSPPPERRSEAPCSPRSISITTRPRRSMRRCGTPMLPYLDGALRQRIQPPRVWARGAACHRRGEAARGLRRGRAPHRGGVHQRRFGGQQPVHQGCGGLPVARHGRDFRDRASLRARAGQGLASLGLAAARDRRG
jgi:hypothetical protein